MVLDKFGRVRLSLESGHLIKGHSQEISKSLSELLTRYSTNSSLFPQIYLIDEFQILDFSSLTAKGQVIKAIREQIDKTNSNIALIIKN